MILRISQKLENFTSNGEVCLKKDLKDEIIQSEIEIMQSGVFSGNCSSYFKVFRDFYERLVVFLIEAKEFDLVDDKFILLMKLYENPLEKENPSLYKSKLISLRLLFFYTSNKKVEYYIFLASLERQILISFEIELILKFEQLIDLGSYQHAFEVVKTLSSTHQILLSRLSKTHRIE